MSNIDCKINDLKLKVICLQSELEDCLCKEYYSNKKLLKAKFCLENSIKKYTNLNYLNQYKYLKNTLTDEQINNISIVLKEEN